MTVLSAQTIKRLGILEPTEEPGTAFGMSYGLGPCGYDLRAREGFFLGKADPYVILISAMERFRMPDDVVGVVHDKSSWARRGLFVQNTVIEPGWEGFLTLELTYHGVGRIEVKPGCPIAQVVFHFLDQPTDRPYRGKYQDQPPRPVSAIDA